MRLFHVAVCFALVGCQAPAALRINLQGDGADIRQRLARLRLDVRDESGTLQITERYELEPNADVRLPALRVPRDRALTLALTGYGRDSGEPLFFGTSPVGISATEVPEITLFLAPVGRFASLPVQPLQKRSDPAVVELSNGEIWIIGGQSPSGQVLRTIGIFDPAHFVFREGPLLATARVGAVAAVLTRGEREVVIVAGGRTDTGVSITAEMVDPAAAASPPVLFTGGARTDAALLVVDGAMVLAGGYDGAQALASCDVLTLDDELKLTARAGLSEQSPALVLPTGTRHAAGVTVSGRHFVVSGTQVLELDLSAHAFKPAAVLNTARVGAPSVTVFDSTLFVSSGGSDAIERWNVSGLELPRTLARPPGTRQRAQMQALPDGSVVVIGGEESGIPLRSSYRVRDQSLDTTSLVTPHVGHRVAMTRNHLLLVIGGARVGDEAEAMAVCDPVADGGETRCQF